MPTLCPTHVAVVHRDHLTHVGRRGNAQLWAQTAQKPTAQLKERRNCFLSVLKPQAAKGEGARVPSAARTTSLVHVTPGGHRSLDRLSCSWLYVNLREAHNTGESTEDGLG